MTGEVFDISCMMCGTQVGEIREGRFVHDERCSLPPVLRGGSVRCCRCGGSLYQERVDPLTASIRPSAAVLERIRPLTR
jgi:hypothetical protein